MGYHIILEVKCKVKPHYVNFIERVLRNGENILGEVCEYQTLWQSLNLDHFYLFELESTTTSNYGDFHFRIEKKPHHHSGDLIQDYMTFMKHIIVPVTEVIHTCEVSHDDFSFVEYAWTDRELRDKTE